MDDTELELILVTSGSIQRGGEKDDDSDDAAGAGPAQNASPQERYLQKDSNDLWALGPLPARGIARSTDLGVALHTYVTQQWSMLVFQTISGDVITIFLELAQGGKRVPWSSIKESTRWYIRKRFLLPNHSLNNPVRISESTLRAYWDHWYNLAQSDQPFTFKRVGLPNETDDGPSKPAKVSSLAEPSDEEEQSEDGTRRMEVEPAGSSTQRIASQPPRTPNQCGIGAERFLFLRSLAGSDCKAYLEVLEMIAQRRVSVYSVVNI